MTYSVLLRHALIDQLLDDTRDAMTLETPALFVHEGAAGQSANVALNVIKGVIGRGVARFPPGPERDAFKLQLATLLGGPLGLLLAGQPMTSVIGTLEGHASQMHLAIGRAPPAPEPQAVQVYTRPSHLKVVQ